MAGVPLRRVLIAGIGGSGKSTLAHRLGQLLGVPYHCLDNLSYAPGLVMADDFPDRIGQITRGRVWLFDSQGPPATSQGTAVGAGNAVVAGRHADLGGPPEADRARSRDAPVGGPDRHPPPAVARLPRVAA